MALEKITAVDLIEVVENGTLHVRSKIIITEDGNQISDQFQHHALVPGADYSGENARVQAIAAVIHTAEVIAAYQASLVAQPA